VQPDMVAAIVPPTYAAPTSPYYAVTNGVSNTNTTGIPPMAPLPPGTYGTPLMAGAPGCSTNACATAVPPVCAPAPAPQVVWQQAPLDPRGAVVAASATAIQGGSSQYVIEHTVSVPRQKSSLLPLVNTEVEGARVSIFNEAVQARYPLLGLRLKNTTGLHLMQGPVTVFEGPGYAGDAQMCDLPTGEQRLVSYAIDFGTDVTATSKDSVNRLVSIQMSKGNLTLTMKGRDSKTYAAKNRATQDRLLLVEHPVRAGYKLVSKEQPGEKTAELYRFEVNVPAGKSANLEVVEEVEQLQQEAMSGCDEEGLRWLAREIDGGPKFQAAMKRAMDLCAKATVTQQDLQGSQQRIQQITEDQQRLRANLKEVPESSAAYKRYLQKFDSQEVELEKLQGHIKQMDEAARRQMQEYVDYLNGLDLESTPATMRSPTWCPLPRRTPAAVGATPIGYPAMPPTATSYRRLPDGTLQPVVGLPPTPPITSYYRGNQR
jgi:hypothetical protein